MRAAGILAGRPGAAAAAGAILVFAAVFDWLAGRRGFFAFDQSIPFDAGWRVLSGQVPFRDFVLPVGPVVPWLQALGFRLFGADYGGYLATGAAVNALAAGTAMLLTARLLPGRRALWIAAGLLTAVWFQPPAGTLWFAQAGALAGFGGLALLAGAALRERIGRLDLAAAAGAGALAVAAFLAKQSAGVFLLPAFAVLLAAPLPRAPRRAARLAAAWLAGLAATAGAFAAWLALAADPGRFADHVLRLPAGLGFERLFDGPWALVAVHAVGIDPPVFQWALLAAPAVAAAALAADVRRDGAGDPRLRTAALLALALFGFQHLLWVSALNQPEMVAVAPGLVVALAGGSAVRWLERAAGEGERRAVGAAVAALALAGLLLAAGGIGAAWSREAHDVFGQVAPELEVGVSGLEPLLWAEPTPVTGPLSDPAEGPGAVRRAELRGLVTALRARPGNLFVFPDWTILYGLTGRPSPQPLLWFDPGLTYPAQPGPLRAALDREIVESLERYRVATVVLEESSWLGTRSRLAHFPALAAHLQRCFAAERRIGLFQLRARRPECPPVSSPG